MLVRLVYVSTAHEKVDTAEFRKILDTANRLNAQKGLTGMLAFNSRFFLQALEGSRDEVNRLYSKLTGDSRHHTLAVLKFEEIAERHWAEWSMGYAAANSDNRALFLKYSPGSTFNPYLMTGDAAEKILMELTRTTVAMAQAAPAAAPTAAEANVIPLAVAPAATLPPQAPTGSGVFSKLFNRSGQ